MSIDRVGVVGAGQMGSGIVEVSAKAGANVVVYEPNEELIVAGRKRITNRSSGPPTKASSARPTATPHSQG